ncbi:MAG: carbamate kinase [Bacteroidetes bacterium]|nr:carbamate kinase [Bacteroidota bacterium]
MNELVLIAVGGNALLRPGEVGSIEQESANAELTAERIADVIERGYRVILTHGNGPQIGSQLLRSESASATVYPLPLDMCVSMTQGEIGLLLQRSLQSALRRRGLQPLAVTLVTQVRVDANSPAFQHPTKPIGPLLTEEEARRKQAQHGWSIIRETGRGYRRAVPSPSPTEIVEIEAIRRCLNEKVVVIAAGGGGVPVIRTNGGMKGIEAVIDKDRTSALLASELGVGRYIMLTDVECVYADFGKPSQRPLNCLTVEEALHYLAGDHFGEGSMKPKIESAIDFLTKGGTEAIITDAGRLLEALEGPQGTHIIMGTPMGEQKWGTAMFEIELTDQERDLLTQAIEVYLSDLRMEIGNTDSSDYREKLKTRKNTLSKILQTLRETKESA